MNLEEVKKAYNNCLSLRWKKRKIIPYNDLDKCLYIVEKYIELVKSIDRDCL